MKRYYFTSTFWIVLASTLAAGFISAATQNGVLAQEPTPGSADIFITVTYTEQINIRNGPSTVLYDVIGYMQPGERTQALGASPGRDWVQIVYPAGQAGIAWVHTSLIEISVGTLQIIEPPPTAAPRFTATVDPTLAAAFVFEPTVTRMPTFTPPPPLEIPQFTAIPVENSQSTIPTGAIVLGLGILGVLSFLVSIIWRR